MSQIIYLDGQYLKVSKQFLEAFTPGIFKAKGVFETMLGLDNVVLDLALHLSRLKRGLKSLGIKTPSIQPSVCHQVLQRNHTPCARVRMMVWQEEKQAHVLIIALPYKIPNQKPYRVCVIKTNRAASIRFAQQKSLDYEMFAQSYAQAQNQGFDEALLLNCQNYIFEASRANIFWVKDKVLFTPPLSSGCLKGITRGQVIAQAKRLKILVKEQQLTLGALKKADAAFLTNSLIGIKPVEITTIKDIS